MGEHRTRWRRVLDYRVLARMPQNSLLIGLGPCGCFRRQLVQLSLLLNFNAIWNLTGINHPLSVISSPPLLQLELSGDDSFRSSQCSVLSAQCSMSSVHRFSVAHSSN